MAAANLLLFGMTGAPYFRAYAADTLTMLEDIHTAPGPFPAGSCSAMSVNPAGTLLAMSSWANPYLYVYDTSTWTRVTITGGEPTGNISQWCEFSPDGTKLAVASNATPYLIVYDTSTWARITITGGTPISSVSCVDWSPDGTKLAVSYSSSPYLVVYDTATWAKLTITGGTPTSSGYCEFSPDGTKLAVVTSDTSVEPLIIYNVAGWSKVAFPEALPTTLFYVVRWSNSGASLSVARTGAEHRVYNTSDWSYTVRTLGSFDIVRALAYSPDDSTIAAGFSAGAPRIRMFSTATWTQLPFDYRATDLTCYSALFSNLPVRTLSTGANAIFDDAGLPASGRIVRAYSRGTGDLTAETTTDAAGKFAMQFATALPAQVVFLDDDAGDTLNDLVLGRVTPTVQA